MVTICSKHFEGLLSQDLKFYLRTSIHRDVEKDTPWCKRTWKKKSSLKQALQWQFGKEKFCTHFFQDSESGDFQTSYDLCGDGDVQWILFGERVHDSIHSWWLPGQVMAFLQKEGRLILEVGLGCFWVWCGQVWMERSRNIQHLIMIHCFVGLLSQWLTFKTFWDCIFSRKNKFKLLFHGPLAA